MTVKGLAALAYPVRIRVVAKYFGFLCISLAAMLIVPGIVAIAQSESQFALRCVSMAGVLAAFGASTARLPVPGGCAGTKR